MSLPSANRRAVVAACADMITACGLTLREIAEHLGVPLEAAPIVVPPAPRDDDALTPRMLEVLQRIDHQDGMTVPELMAVMGLIMQCVFTYLDRLLRMGRAVRVKAPGVRLKRYFVDPAHAQRWVDSHVNNAAAELAREQALQAERDAAEKAKADALAAERQRHAQEREAIRAQRQQEQQQRHAEKRQQAAARPAAPATAKVPPSPNPNAGVVLHDNGRPQMRGQAIETEATRRTIDSTNRPNNRIEAAPSLPPDPRWPSFAALGLGIDPATGRPWEKRA